MYAQINAVTISAKMYGKKNTVLKKVNKEKTRVLYKNTIVWAHYCKSKKGEWIQ